MVREGKCEIEGEREIERYEYVYIVDFLRHLEILMRMQFVTGKYLGDEMKF